jgi:hypothetical protein
MRELRALRGENRIIYHEGHEGARR